MLIATLAGRIQEMSEILKFAHDTESPIFSYNSEIELSAVVNLVYLAARDCYRVEREDKAGEGYVDFIFYPKRRSADAIILELKVDSTPDEAIRQIKKRDMSSDSRESLGKSQNIQDGSWQSGSAMIKKRKSTPVRLKYCNGAEPATSSIGEYCRFYCADHMTALFL